jgi:peptidoglycan hydrolase CwlO-like protein
MTNAQQEEAKKLEKQLDSLIKKYQELESKSKTLKIRINQLYNKLDGLWGKR